MADRISLLVSRPWYFKAVLSDVADPLVKCDEIRPECGNCQRYGASCDFLGSIPAVSPDHGTSMVAEASPPLALEVDFALPTSPTAYSSSMSVSSMALVHSGAENLYQMSLPTIYNLEPDDHELFQLYTEYTSFTLSDKPLIQKAWRSDVAREALPYAYLLHGLVSLSAAHLAHINPSERIIYGSKAIMHRNRALRLCIPALRHITKANCQALFAFSSIVAISTFAILGLLDVGVTSPIDTISTFFTLIKGVSTVVQGGVEWIKAGSLGVLLHDDRTHWRSSLGPLPQELHFPLQRLREWNETSGATGPQISVCAAAINDLEVVFSAHSMIAGDRTLVFVWCAIVTNEYIEQVKSRQSMALVVLAHFAVLLHGVRSQWWSADRGRRIVEAVYEELDTYWKPAVQWPVEVVCEDLLTAI